MAAHEAILLSTEVNPTNYRITLAPDFDHFTFSGSEDIDLVILKPVRQITLHGVGLTVFYSYLSVSGYPDEDMRPPVETNEQAETVTFMFDREIPAGNAVLHITFQGVLSDNMSGFYRSRVDMGGGITRWMATTQFEATDARKAFFCIDEPARKATFEVSLVSPHDFVAISNMPVVKKTAIRGGFYNSYRFEKTPIMSTYLLAFVIGPMEGVETMTPDGVRVRVYTMPGKKEQGLFALDVASRILPFFNNYFGIPYPLPKLDLIALQDFAAGVMENWGAITYRETALLFDPANSSPAMKQRIAIVVVHEIAHQWFGNLVTMNWWNDLWLNEGFASWIEYLAVDYLFPEWDIWTQFVASDFASALDLDGLKNSHPIEQEVGHPDEISELFDAISYSKGSVVIRMLQNYLGKDVFAAGLKHYLTLHAYGNARTADLWSALEEFSGKPVTQLMSGWTQQMGYPVVMVEETHDGLILQQSRFLANGERPTAQEKQLWHVPLMISLDGQNKIRFDLIDEVEPLLMEFPRGTCMKLNAGQTTLCRVNYTPEQWRLLQNAVACAILPAVDRLGLENDAFALARAGYIAITQALELAASYGDETDYAVWADLCGNLAACGSLWFQEPFYHKHYRRFVRELVRPTVDLLEWDAESGEGHLTALLRSMMINVAGYHGMLSVIVEASHRFDCYLQDSEALDPNLRAAVYNIVVADGGKRRYDQMIDLYRLATMSEEKNRCLRALGSVKDLYLLRHALEFGFSSEVRSQDMMYVIAGVAGNPLGRDVAWKFLQENWQEFKDRYHGGAISLFSRVIGMVTSQFVHEEKACEIEEFFRSHGASGAKRTIQQSLERVRWNAQFLASSREAAGQWLEQRR